MIFLGIALVLAIMVLAVFTPPAIEYHENSRVINAPTELVWEVVSDVGNYHEYATGLSNVTIISGTGQGMVRSCSDELGAWKETCTLWDEGKRYSFQVDTGSGFPYPFKKMVGTWTVERLDKNFSKIRIQFEYQFPYRWMSWLFSEDTHKVFDKGDKTLLDNWEKAITDAVATADLTLAP